MKHLITFLTKWLAAHPLMRRFAGLGSFVGLAVLLVVIANLLGHVASRPEIVKAESQRSTGGASTYAVAGDTTTAQQSDTPTNTTQPTTAAATQSTGSGSAGTQGNVPSVPSTPNTPPTPSNTPTKPIGDWPLEPHPPAGFTCNVSQDWLALAPGQETGWITMSTSDGSNVYWEPFYNNVIWKNGVNNSPTASYWMVLDHNTSSHIASSVKFKVKVGLSALLTGTPGTGTHEEVMMFITDASRDIYMGCEFNFTVVAG